MNRLPVESTTLAAAAYSPDRSLLELEFLNGAVYHFFDVPAACFHQLMASDSKGSYFNRNIRNSFRFQMLSKTEQETK